MVRNSILIGILVLYISNIQANHLISNYNFKEHFFKYKINITNFCDDTIDKPLYVYVNDTLSNGFNNIDFLNFLDPPVNSNRPLNYLYEVGKIDGIFNVDYNGQANYIIPIQLPTGTNTLEPQLNFTYNSKLSNGIMGRGWQIEGLSSIKRTEASIFHDGYRAGIKMTSLDRYELDGKRLIVIEGQIGDDIIIFRTSDETFNKITCYENNDKGPSYFIVESKDGMKSYYGDTQESKLFLPKSNGVYEWLLRRIEDKQGNYIDYFYKYENNFTYIDRIEYTGNSFQGLMPYNKIQFIYSQYENYETYYVVNDLVLNDLLLTETKISSLNNTISYHFDYIKQNSPLLNQITLKTADGKQFNSTVFTYHDNSNDNYNGYALTPESLYDLLEADTQDFGGGTLLTAHDFNNDGRMDLISINDDTKFPHDYCAHYQDHNRFVLGYSQTDINELNQSYTFIHNENGLIGPNLEKALIGDFNGDGFSDIALALRKKSDQNGFETWNVHLLIKNNTDNLFSEQHLNTDLYFAEYRSNYPNNYNWLSDFNNGDFNGDNSDELLLARMVGNDNLELNIIDYTSQTQVLFNIDVIGTFKTIILDFDGDGIDEILVADELGLKLYKFSSHDIMSSQLILLYFDNDYNSSSELLTGYFNKDAKTDLLAYEKNRGWRLLISDGTKYISKGLYGVYLSSPGYYGRNVKIVTDFDGDGLSDIIDFGGSEQENEMPEVIKIYYIRGSQEGLFGVSEIEVPENIVGENNSNLLWGDFDGNGSVELIFNNFKLQNGCNQPVELNHDYEIINSNINFKKQLLSNIVDGLNFKTEVTYNFAAFGKPGLEQWVNNTYANLLVTPYFLTKRPIYLVDSVLFQSTTTISKERYIYDSPIYNFQSNNFIGFSKITKTINLGEKKVIFNSLISGLNSMLTTQISEYARTGQLTNRTDFTYDLEYLFTGVCFTHLTRKHTFDAQKNTKINETYTYNTYDILYGNITEATKSYFADNELQESTTVVYDDYINTGGWCPSMPSKIKNLYTKPNFPNIIRETKFEYYLTGDYIGKVKTIINHSNLPNPIFKRFEYNEYGNIINIDISGSDFDSQSTSFQFDEFGRYPIQIINALGHIKRYTYNDHFGVPTVFIDEKGLETAYQYDSFGRLSTILNPDGTTTQETRHWDDTYYSSIFKLVTKHSGRAEDIHYFDDILRLSGSSFQNFQGKYVNKVYGYNAYDQLTKESELTTEYTSSNDIKWVYYTYNVYNRLNSIATPTNQKSINYHRSEIKVTDENIGKQTTMYYDSKGVLRSIYEEPDNQIIYVYDAEGKLINTQVNRSEYIHTYDIYGFPKSYWDASLGLIQYEYNSLGLLTQKVDPKGQIINYKHDKLNRMISEEIVKDKTVNYYFDQTPQSIGEITEIRSTENLIFKYEYDEFGRLISESESINDVLFKYLYDYDQQGRLNKITYPNSFVIVNNYNDYGYLNKIINGNTNELIMQIKQCDEYGRPLEYKFGNNTITSRKFNQMNKVIEEIRTMSASSVGEIFNMTYTTCPRMNIINSRRDNIRNLEETFQYDNHQRIKSISGIGDVPSAQYEYSSNGNIMESDIALYSYDYSNEHQAVRSLEIKDPSFLKIQPQTIEYNAANRASKITEGSFEYRIQYGPDRKRKKTESYENGILSKVKYYMKNYEKIVDQYSTSENSFIFGPSGLIAIHQKVNNSKEYIFYAHTDHLGSIMFYTNESGEVVRGSQASFDAWGNRRDPVTWQPFKEKPPSLLYDRGFTGHEHIEQAGIINMNGRLYDPLIARFLSPDVFIQLPTNSQSFNRYSYVMNNPINLIDLSGYIWQDYEDIPPDVDNELRALLEHSGYTLDEVIVMASRMNPMEEIWIMQDGFELERVYDWYDAEKNRPAGQGGYYKEGSYSYNKTHLQYLPVEGVGLFGGWSNVRGNAKVYRGSDRKYYANVSATGYTPARRNGDVTFSGSVDVFVGNKIVSSHFLQPFSGPSIIQSGRQDVGSTMFGLPNANADVYLRFNVGYSYSEGAGYVVPWPSQGHYRIQVGFTIDAWSY